MILAFSAVLMVIYAKETSRKNEDTVVNDSSSIKFWLAIGADTMSAIVMAFIYVIMRKLKHVHFILVNGLYGMVLCVVSVVMLCFGRLRGKTFECNFDFEEIMLIIAIGTFK